MVSRLQDVAAVLARFMLCAIFFMSAVGNDIPNFGSVVEYMKLVGMPAPELMLVGAIVFLIVGSISVLFGWKARIGAGLLLIFLVLATYYFHAFWNLTGQEQKMQMIEFLKNLSIAGAMLFIMANGAGRMALDNCCSKNVVS
jgi:putative oxidoreductase